MGNCCGKGAVPRDDDKLPYGDDKPNKKETKKKNSKKNAKATGTTEVKEVVVADEANKPTNNVAKELPKNTEQAVQEAVIVNKDAPSQSAQQSTQKDEIAAGKVEDVEKAIPAAKEEEVLSEHKAKKISRVNSDVVSTIIEKTATSISKSEFRKPSSLPSPLPKEDLCPPPLPTVEAPPTNASPPASPPAMPSPPESPTKTDSPPQLPDVEPPQLPRVAPPVDSAPNTPTITEVDDVIDSNDVMLTTANPGVVTSSAPVVKERPSLPLLNLNGSTTDSKEETPVEIRNGFADQSSEEEEEEEEAAIEKSSPIVKQRPVIMASPPSPAPSQPPPSPVRSCPSPVRSRPTIKSPVASPPALSPLNISNGFSHVDAPISPSNISPLSKPSPPSPYSPSSPQPTDPVSPIVRQKLAPSSRPVSQAFPLQTTAHFNVDRSFADVPTIDRDTRDNELLLVDDWFTNNTSRKPLAVVGKQCVGKTCLLARVALDYGCSGQLSSSYAFNQLDDERTSLRGALLSLAKQCDVTLSSDANNLDLYAELMTSMPVSLDTDHRVIVLDAVDECREASDLYDIVSEFHRRAPKQLHLVVSINQKHRERLRDVTWLEVKNGSVQQSDSVKRILREPLSLVTERINLATGLDILARATKGNMLCARSFRARLEALHSNGGHLSLGEIQPSFPTGLGELLRGVFADLRAILSIGMREDAAAVVYTRVLGALCLARRPLRVATEFEAFVDARELNTAALFAELSDAVLVQRGCVRLRHAAVRDFLLDETLAGEYRLDERDAKRAMASACVAALTSHESALNDYSLQYGVEHALLSDQVDVDDLVKVICSASYRGEKLARYGDCGYAADVAALLSDRRVSSTSRNLLKRVNGETHAYFEELTKSAPTPSTRKRFSSDLVIIAVDANDSRVVVLTTSHAPSAAVYLHILDRDLREVTASPVEVSELPGYAATSPGDQVHAVLCLTDGAAFVGSYSHLVNIDDGSTMESRLEPVELDNAYSIEAVGYDRRHLVSALNTLTHSGRSLHIAVHDLEAGSRLALVEVVRFRFGGSPQFGVRCCCVSTLHDRVLVAACVKHTSKAGVSIYLWTIPTDGGEITRHSGELAADAYAKCSFVGPSTVLFSTRLPSSRPEAPAVLWRTDISDVKTLDYGRGACVSGDCDDVLVARASRRCSTVAYLTNVSLAGGDALQRRYQLYGCPADLNDVIAHNYDGDLQSILVSKNEINAFKQSELKPITDDLRINDLNLISVAISNDNIYVAYRDEGNTCSVGELMKDGSIKSTVFYKELFEERKNFAVKQHFRKGHSFLNGDLVLSHDSRYLILNATQDNIKIWHITNEDGLPSAMVTLIPSWTAASMMISEQTDDTDDIDVIHRKLQRILVSPKENNISVIYHQQPWRIFTYDIGTSRLLRKINLQSAAQACSVITDYVYQTVTSNMLTYHEDSKLVVFWNSVNGQQKSKENINLDFGLVSPTSDRVLLKDVDCTIQLRNADLRFRVFLNMSDDKELENAAFSLDGTILIGTSRDSCDIWNAGNGDHLRLFRRGPAVTRLIGWIDSEHVLLSDGLLSISGAADCGQDVVAELGGGAAGVEAAAYRHVVVRDADTGALCVYVARNMAAATQSSLEYASKEI